MIKGIRKAAVLAVAVATGVSFGLGSLDAKPARAEGTLVWAIPAAMSLFDPPQSCGWLTKNATHMIFDGLVELELGKPEQPWATLRPALAESWDISPDGLTYTFHIRQGVKFSNGDPLTMDDIKWSLDRMLDPNIDAGWSFLMGDIAGFEAADASTLKMTMKKVNASVLYTLSLPAGGIASKKAFDSISAYLAEARKI